MKIEIEKKNKIVVLHVNGNLDAESIHSFKKAVYPVVEEGYSKWVMDCKSLEFIDSMGLGVLISLLRRIRTNKGDLKVCSLSPDVRSIFEITRLHRLFEILPDWQTACERWA